VNCNHQTTRVDQRGRVMCKACNRLVSAEGCNALSCPVWEPVGDQSQQPSTRKLSERIIGALLIAGFWMLIGCLVWGCASNPSQYPIIKPLDPVTNQEIIYVK